MIISNSEVFKSKTQSCTMSFVVEMLTRTSLRCVATQHAPFLTISEAMDSFPDVVSGEVVDRLFLWFDETLFPFSLASPLLVASFFFMMLFFFFGVASVDGAEMLAVGDKVCGSSLPFNIVRRK